jgi:MinD superfamily P-loop ATPase
VVVVAASRTIAIASGKGGTGKTTLALNLAAVADAPAALLDCDVEEPNLHVFLAPRWGKEQRVTVPVPTFDEALCERCGDCRAACRFNALAVLPGGPMLFAELCHSCGGCLLACPTEAASEGEREIGTLRTGRWRKVTVVEGRLDVGEARGVPLVEAVRRAAPEKGLVLVDAPPGTSCPVVASVRGADYLVLVTEPTPFGLHDLKLAVEMAATLALPCGVVLNRAGLADADVEAYCARAGVPLLAKVPLDRRIAEAYARGSMVVDELPQYRPLFTGLLEQLTQAATQAAGGDA